MEAVLFLLTMTIIRVGIPVFLLLLFSVLVKRNKAVNL